MIALSAGAEISFGGEITMNTDKIYAEAIANEYAPKEASKVLALKKLEHEGKKQGKYFCIYVRRRHGSRARDRNVPLNGCTGQCFL